MIRIVESNRAGNSKITNLKQGMEFFQKYPEGHLEKFRSRVSGNYTWSLVDPESDTRVPCTNTAAMNLIRKEIVAVSERDGQVTRYKKI